MADTAIKKGLNKVLGLTDLILIGISTILGSGGFNLIGKAIKDGGRYFPLTLLLSGGLFMGSAHSYSYAHDTFESNTSETQLIEKVFGPIGKYTSVLSIMVYSIFATATILVLSSKLLFPKGTWMGQVTFALLLLSMMTFAAFQQLDVNKNIINIFSLFIIIILGSSTFLGFTKVSQEGFEMPSFPSKTNLYESLLYFFFILAGHDTIVKFSEETKDSKDINRSMYISIGISILLVAGISLAAVTWISDFRSTNVDNIISDIFQKALDHNIGIYIGYGAIIAMIITTFIGFLATIRYTYGITEDIPFLNFIREGGDGHVSHVSILIIAILCSLAIFINQTSSLVEISDIALIMTLLLVSISAFYEKYRKGLAPVSDGLTSGGLLGILGLTIQKHLFT